nr:MAG TPA: hypothetical protein [Bacteriophage sp.]
MNTEITEAKELIELHILQQILDATKLAEITFINGIKIIEGIDGKKYNLDKMRERCDYLFDKIMKPYAI